MLLTLISQEKIHTSSLPQEPSGMLWVAETAGFGSKRYGLIEAKDDAWVLSPKKGMQLLDHLGNELETAKLNGAPEVAFKLGTPDASATLLIRKRTAGDKQFKIVGFKSDEVLTIGSSGQCNLHYASPFVSPEHARIDYYRDEFFLTRLDAGIGTFVNGCLAEKGARITLKAGDIIEVFGLNITVGHRFISLNNPSNALTVQSTENFVYFVPPPYHPPEPSVEDGSDEVQYFYPAPRFKRNIEKKSFTVDAPPNKEKPDETSIAMKIGPSLVMALVAVFSGVTMFTNVMSSDGSGNTILRALPSLFMAISMICGALVWPLINSRMQKKKIKRDEEKRKAVYATYLDEFRLRLEEETRLQHEILRENRIPATECVERALTHDAQLMDRTPAHDDFLELRVGIGTVALSADIKYPEERFSLEKDELAEVVYALSREPRDIQEAPMAVSLTEHAVMGIAGEASLTHPFTFGLITQVATLHSYEDVKCLFLIDETDKEQWRWALNLPHTFDDTKQSHLSATTLEEASEIGLMLERIAEERRGNANKLAPIPHYVIFVPSKHLAAKSELVSKLCKYPAPGITVVTLAREAKDLPKQCSVIIELTAEEGVLRSKDDIHATPHAFLPDRALTEAEVALVSTSLNALTLDLAESRTALPTSLGFLESFEAGNLEQLSVKSRWAKKLGSTTLAAQVGVDPQGEPFYLNLHEKFHGPHGLIAGTTGSGKSEFIITWILSMCINYSPEDAAFVLIDYKGGGLAGAFDNERFRLPHLAGTITNLDGAAINRSLVSIKSELKRRQNLFNEAREVAGGDNIDIYKYLELYHAGEVSEPCPHLFIVADEFAELKSQEPEFMDELISAARIGRSLGVHLVLATQKPSGVVNDQIWSNSKFKICLKVADKADSTEMIKRADAAEIKEAGRFYMLIGYNEYFASGQSAYTGGAYKEEEQFTPQTDNSVILVSNTGRALQAMKPRSEGSTTEKPPSEIVAVLSHLVATAKEEGLQANQLWLDPIPEHITVDELEEKYAEELANLRTNPFELNPIIGELDDPENQSQRLLTLPLSAEGNAVVYGSAGSGKATLLASLLYSLLTTHTASTLNVYILDFGAESLGAFKSAPQVGDVAFSNDEEKITNLLRILTDEAEARRKLFASSGGSISRYNQSAKTPVPSIVVIINNYDLFAEIYEHYVETLFKLSRDASKYGINLIVTASRVRSLGYKLLPTFKQSLALRLSDKDEYQNVFGSMRGIHVSDVYARGLVHQEQILEFQAAHISPEQESDYEAIVDALPKFLAGSDGSSSDDVKARAIPTLPETIIPSSADKQSIITDKQLLLGVSKDRLAPSLHDFKKSPVMMILGEDEDLMLSPVRGLIAIFNESKPGSLLVLDPGERLSDYACNQRIICGADSVACTLEALLKNEESAEYIFFFNLRGCYESLEKDLRKSFEDFFIQGTYKQYQGIIASGEVAQLNALNFAPWYKELTESVGGLYVGGGLNNQPVFKISRIPSEYHGAIPEGYGFNVFKGRFDYIKIVQEDVKRENPDE